MKRVPPRDDWRFNPGNVRGDPGLWSRATRGFRKKKRIQIRLAKPTKNPPPQRRMVSTWAPPGPRLSSGTLPAQRRAQVLPSGLSAAPEQSVSRPSVEDVLRVPQSPTLGLEAAGLRRIAVQTETLAGGNLALVHRPPPPPRASLRFLGVGVAMSPVPPNLSLSASPGLTQTKK